jgi:hypothetical protein
MSSGRVGVALGPRPMPMPIMGVSMSESCRSELALAAGLLAACVWRCAVPGVAKVGVGAAAGVRAAEGGAGRRPVEKLLPGVGMPLAVRAAVAGICGAQEGG